MAWGVCVFWAAGCAAGWDTEESEGVDVGAEGGWGRLGKGTPGEEKVQKALEPTGWDFMNAG
jgi:hypothetical protein